MDNMNNSTLETITARGDASKVNYHDLPEVAYFRVQSRGAVGTLRDLHDRKVGAWALLVSCKDGKGLRLVSDVGYEHGMKIRGEFATREAAIEAGKKYQEKFGKVRKSEIKKDKKPTKQELEDEVATLKAMIAEMKKAA